MISLHQVSKQFDSKTVINNISLEIEEGEVVGFLGPNGAGKTTTMRMVAGVLPPSAGRVMINDEDLFSENLVIHPSIGYLPENNPLYDDLTVEEFLHFWADIKIIPVRERQARIEEAVCDVGLEEVFYRPIAELSKGFRQRTGLAQAVLAKPDILLLDEPTEGLDPNQRREIQTLLKNLGEKRTVIICSHVLSEITKMCSRIVIVNKGSIVADAPASQLGQLAGGHTTIEVVAKGKAIEKSLADISGVKTVEKKDETVAPRWIVTVEGDKDIRLDIFNEAKKQNWKLYEIVRKQQDLEEVFAKLTLDYEA